MKLKVGDKAKVIKEGSHCQSIGTIVEIVEVDEKYNRYRANCPYNGKWYFSEDELVIDTYSKPTKQELLDMPVGTIIYIDAEDEDERILVKDPNGDFVNGKMNYLDKDYIYDDLTFDKDEEYGTKIIKIEKPTYKTIYDYSTEVQEMTVAEIEKALGHAVKIIKEDN